MKKENKKTYLTPLEAAAQVGVTKTTIYTWCSLYDIGFKVGGRWRVDPGRLAAMLDGTSYRELLQQRGIRRKQIEKKDETDDIYKNLAREIIDRTGGGIGKVSGSEGEGQDPGRS